MAETEFLYSDLLPTGVDDTPYRLDLVAQGAQDPAVRLRVWLLVAGFGGIEDAEEALLEPQSMLESSGTWLETTKWVHLVEGGEDAREHPPLRGIHDGLAHEPGRDARRHIRPLQDREEDVPPLLRRVQVRVVWGVPGVAGSQMPAQVLPAHQ
ncbi:MAG TPA: hypothetical protein VHM69_06725 [Rubrobacter sp.]|nr:hypothetical protein [Rubrobacter sp.]